MQHALAGRRSADSPWPASRNIRERAEGRQDVGQGASRSRRGQRTRSSIRCPPGNGSATAPRKGKTISITTHSRTHACTHARLPHALCLVRVASQGKGSARTDGGTMRAWAGGSCRAGGRDRGQEGAADDRGYKEEEKQEGRSAHWRCRVCGGEEVGQWIGRTCVYAGSSPSFLSMHASIVVASSRVFTSPLRRSRR